MGEKKPQSFKLIYYGLTFGVTMVIFLYLGYKGGQWLDNYFGTENIFVLLGVLLGIVISFKNLWETLMQMEREGKSKRIIDKEKHKNDKEK